MRQASFVGTRDELVAPPRMFSTLRTVFALGNPPASPPLGLQEEVKRWRANSSVLRSLATCRTSPRVDSIGVRTVEHGLTILFGAFCKGRSPRSIDRERGREREILPQGGTAFYISFTAGDIWRQGRRRRGESPPDCASKRGRERACDGGFRLAAVCSGLCANSISIVCFGFIGNDSHFIKVCLWQQ